MKSETIRLEYLKEFNTLIDKLHNNGLSLTDIAKALNMTQGNLTNTRNNKQKANIGWLIDKIELLKEVIEELNL